MKKLFPVTLKLQRIGVIFCLLSAVIVFGCQKKDEGASPSPPDSTKTNTPDRTHTLSPTITGTITGTQSATPTVTPTFTVTPTYTCTPTFTGTGTATLTTTPTPTVTLTSTETPCAIVWGNQTDNDHANFAYGYLIAVPVTVPAHKTINQVTVKFEAVAGETYGVGIYTDNSGSPGSLMNEVNGVPLDNGGWITSVFPDTTLFFGGDYWVVIAATGTGAGRHNCRSAYVPGALALAITYAYTGTMPATAPAGWTEMQDNEFKIFLSRCL